MKIGINSRDEMQRLGAAIAETAFHAFQVYLYWYFYLSGGNLLLLRFYFSSFSFTFLLYISNNKANRSLSSLNPDGLYALSMT